MKPVLAVWGLLSATVVSPLVGQGDDERARKTLTGLQGVYVVVSVSDGDEVRQDGLRREQLQIDVELKLRQAGIPVLTREEARSSASPASLVVNVICDKTSGSYTCSVETELYQEVKLTRNPSAVTWTRTWWAPRAIGSIGAASISDLTRNVVKDQTDQFINAYLAANPKR